MFRHRGTGSLSSPNCWRTKGAGPLCFKSYCEACNVSALLSASEDDALLRTHYSESLTVKHEAPSEQQYYSTS